MLVEFGKSCPKGPCYRLQELKQFVSCFLSLNILIKNKSRAFVITHIRGMENWKDIKSFTFNLLLCTSKKFFCNSYPTEFWMFAAELRWGRRQLFPSWLFAEVSFDVLGLHSSFQRKSCLQLVNFYYSPTSVWMVFCFTFEEAGRGLLQVESCVYYGFMSCFPVCLLCSEQHGFHHKQTIPSSFILGFWCHFLLHLMRNSKKSKGRFRVSVLWSFYLSLALLDN